MSKTRTTDYAIGLDAIRKKLIGKRLTYKEIYAIMDAIAHKRLGDVLTTYFTASGYSKGFSDQELYFLTKAMVETGKRLNFKGIVADKHSIGGLPGTRTTLIIVPIIASAGFLIPKSSSRAITTPGGTADAMEVLARVNFSEEEIYKIVQKTNGCIVWGGSFNIAPADDEIIRVEQPLLFESFDKIIVSIMAKKVAFGSTHIVIDIPYGQTAKVSTLKDAEYLQKKFTLLAKKFNMKIRCLIHRTEQPFGRGIGPLLEAREALRVLQQKQNRPVDLEVRALNLASNLLDLCLKDSSPTLKKEVKKNFGNCYGWATSILQTGEAFEKMQEIIKAQGGNPNIDSEDLKPGEYSFTVRAKTSGVVKMINSKNATILARILGAPKVKSAGLFLEKRIGDKVGIKDALFHLYAKTPYRLKEAKDSLENFPVVIYY
jgi:AMP phosphorylase